MVDLLTDAQWYKITKDLVQALAWIGTVVAALVASFKAITEMRLGRMQREQELRWKQAQLGRELVDEIYADARTADACMMLDYGHVGREFQQIPSDNKTVSQNDILLALDTVNEDNSPRSIYIRECFEDLMYYVDRLEYFIEHGLVTFEDVKVPLEYYHRFIRSNWELYETFARGSRYVRFPKFFKRFEDVA